MPPVKITEYIFFLMDDVSSGEIRQEFVFFSLVSAGFLIFPSPPPLYCLISKGHLSCWKHYSSSEPAFSMLFPFNLICVADVVDYQLPLFSIWHLMLDFLFPSDFVLRACPLVPSSLFLVS